MPMASILYPLLLAAEAAAPVPPIPSAAIFATIGHSEWCPAGTVFVDLRTGAYSLMRPAPRPACQAADVKRRVEEGILTRERLMPLRKAYEAVQRDGMQVQACRDGKGAPDIVLSNGGQISMVVSGGAQTEAAPVDKGCWTDAAEALHQVMDETFRNARPPF